MLPDHPVNVTYTSTPTSLRQLPYILSSLNSQLPLRNFHWKSATKPSVRTIQECDVKLHKLVDFQTRTREWSLPKDVGAGSLIEGCLVHVCFVECEVSARRSELSKNVPKHLFPRIMRYTNLRSSHISLLGSVLFPHPNYRMPRISLSW